MYLNIRGFVLDAIPNNPENMRDNLPRSSQKQPIAVIDFETDPFLWGRLPQPFILCFYTDTMTRTFWGNDCAEQFITFLDSLRTKYLIYAHNGGKFDYHFLHKYLEDPMLIIKNRIVKCYIRGHELRDSFAALPVPLEDFGGKMKFDYTKNERHCRERYRDEITTYCIQDCAVLHNAVTSFIERYGKRLTIGGTAIKELRKHHPFRDMNSRHDGVFRPYYMGGRVQCFAGGELDGPWKLVDVNSMYPYVMATRYHPINGCFEDIHSLPDDLDIPFFIHFTGTNRNALAARNDDGSLSFTRRYGEFRTTNHELKVAMEHGLVDIETIHSVLVACEYTKFDTFVAQYAAEKAAAKRANDKLSEVFSKLLMNSGYGRAGINPANFEDWVILRDIDDEEALLTALNSEGEPHPYSKQMESEDLELWSRSTEVLERNYCDVAIAASITSAARATLLEGLQASDNPIYCDTDSIICRDFRGNIDPYELGAWDLECIADKVAIAGKKQYVLYNDQANIWDKRQEKYTNVAKLSSKGGRISLDQIRAICRGASVQYENPAPNFSLHGRQPFQRRTFTATYATDTSGEGDGPNPLLDET